MHRAAFGLAILVAVLFSRPAAAKAWWGLTPGTSTKADVLTTFGTAQREMPASARYYSGLVYQGSHARERGADEAQFYFDKEKVLTDVFVFLAVRIGREDVIRSYGSEYEAGRTHAGNLYFDYRSEGFIVVFEKDDQWVMQLQFTRPKAPRSSPPGIAAPAATPDLGKFGSGSGVFISADGHILTAAHVVARARKVMIVTAGVPVEATVLKIDEANDLAVLKAEVSSPVKPLLLGSPKSVSLGSSVFTVGYPNIQVQGVEPKFTQGVVNSLAGLQDDPRMFQISAEVQPGNSGGPLVNDRGEIVGVVVSKLNTEAAIRLTGDLPQNVNYAIKSSYATMLMDSIPLRTKTPAAASKSILKTEEVARRIVSASVLVLVQE